MKGGVVSELLRYIRGPFWARFRLLPKQLVRDIYRELFKGTSQERKDIILCFVFPPFLIYGILNWYLRFFKTELCLYKEKKCEAFNQRASKSLNSGTLYLGEGLQYDQEVGKPKYIEEITKEKWVKRTVKNGNPVNVDWKSITSASLVGSPGCGKTTQAISVASQLVNFDPKSSVIYIDCKGDDPEIFRTLKHFAEQSGREFKYVSSECEPSHAFNPLEALADSVSWDSEFSKHLQAALGVGEGLGHNYFSVRGQEGIDQAIKLNREASTFSKLYEVLNDPENKELYPSRDSWKELAGLRGAINVFQEVPQFNQSRYVKSKGTESVYENVDLPKLIESGGSVIYFRMRNFHSMVPLMVRVIYQTIRILHEKGSTNQRVVLLADELHRVLPHGPGIFSELIALSRTVSMHPIFIFQNFSQIQSITKSRSLVQELLDIPVTLYFGSNDGFSKELIAGEWCNEKFKSYSENSSTPAGPNGVYTAKNFGVSDTYLRIPQVRESLLQWLSTSSDATHCYLARIARGKGIGLYTLGKTIPATDLETYIKLKSKGWPQSSELMGAVVPERTQIFRQNTDNSEDEIESEPSETDSTISSVLGNFSKGSKH